MRRFILLILCLVCATRTVSADTRQLIIHNVVVDQRSGLSLISGKYFGSTPTVTINDIQVSVLNGSSQLLLIELPASVRAQPGTYRITVERDRTPNGQDTFSLTIVSAPSGGTGKAGPPGPAGPAGPAGLAGPMGPAGAAGSAGAVGPAGPVGPVGPAGPAGTKGTNGTNGSNGINGMKGDKGDTGATGPAGSGVLRLVDAGGKEVGMFAPPNSVIREIDGTWAQLALAANATEGLAPCSATDPCAASYFADVDCKGPAYMPVWGSLLQDARFVDGNIQYPGGAPPPHSIRSAIFDGVNCVGYGGGIEFAEMKSVPLSSLGDFVAPLHLER